MAVEEELVAPEDSVKTGGEGLDTKLLITMVQRQELIHSFTGLEYR